MTTRRSLSLVVAFGLALSGAATGSLAAEAEGPWTVALRYGDADLRASHGSFHPKTFDDANEGFGFGVAYAFNDFFGVELGYHDLGAFAGTGSPCREGTEECVEILCPIERLCTRPIVALETEVSTWYVAAVPRWPLTERFSLFGKLGLANWESTVSGLFESNPTERFTGSDVLTGAGLGYSLPRGVEVTVEHHRFEPDTRWTGVGLGWRF